MIKILNKIQITDFQTYIVGILRINGHLYAKKQSITIQNKLIFIINHQLFVILFGINLNNLLSSQS
jgi:hypothetical protein